MSHGTPWSAMGRTPPWKLTFHVFFAHFLERLFPWKKSLGRWAPRGLPSMEIFSFLKEATTVEHRNDKSVGLFVKSPTLFSQFRLDKSG